MTPHRAAGHHRFAGLGCTPSTTLGRLELVIECDSEQFHGGWDKQERDRARDLALAALEYTTLRPTATAIMWHPETVMAAVRGLQRARAVLGG